MDASINNYNDYNNIRVVGLNANYSCIDNNDDAIFLPGEVFTCVDKSQDQAFCFSFQDYKDHIAELANKLVFIMDSMLEANLAKVNTNTIEAQWRGREIGISVASSSQM